MRCRERVGYAVVERSGVMKKQLFAGGGEKGRPTLGRIASLGVAALVVAGGAAASPPETVHVTYHVQSGKLDEFLAVLREHFPTGRKLGIVLAEPHLVLVGKEDGGRPVVIEIFTWRDADDPDNVATKYPSVRAIWDRMNALVEKRGGKSAIDIDEVEIVPRAEAPRRQEKR
jgi:hypothetical protein